MSFALIQYKDGRYNDLARDRNRFCIEVLYLFVEFHTSPIIDNV